MKIILRQITRHPWSNINRYQNCREGIGVYYTRTGRVYTGLTDADAERLGKILKVDLNPYSEFWHTYKVRVSDEDMLLDTQDPMDELKYLFLKNHKRVASSLTDRKPTANYVLINKEEEANEANSYNRTKRKALAYFDKMKPEEIKKALRIYGYGAEDTTDDVAEARLNDLIEDNPQKFIERWIDNAHRQTEWLLKEAISKNVIRKNKNIHKYGSDVIGASTDETVYFLDNPENQDIKRAIIEEIEAKK